MKSKSRTIAIVIALATMAVLTACERQTDQQVDCRYMPWAIEEYQLFGMTQKAIISNWQANFSSTENSIVFGNQGFNLEFDKDSKVCAVRRFFIGCKHTYYGPKLESKSEALNYCINGLADFQDAESKAKLAAAKKLLAALSTSNDKH